MKPIVVFDLETTGVDIDKDRIVQIAAAKMWEGRTDVETFTTKVNPQCEIPKEASEVHGLYYKDVKHAPTFNDIAHRVYTFFNDCTVAGFNCMRFDVPLMWSMLSECGYVLPIPKVIDCWQIYIKEQPRDLQHAHEYYCNATFDGAHDALNDVMATGRIMLKQYERNDESFEKLIGLSKDPDQIDLLGKLKRKDDKIVLTFGKYKDTPLEDIPKSYFQWCRKNNVFSSDGWEAMKDYFLEKK